MRIWFDEDLSPSLVQVAIECGFEATCNRDRNMLGSKDLELRRVAQAEEYVLLTDNASDFRPMHARDDVHPGLVVVPGAVRRERQQALTRAAIHCIVGLAARASEEPADFMTNKQIEIDEQGKCSVRDLPPA